MNLTHESSLVRALHVALDNKITTYFRTLITRDDSCVTENRGRIAHEKAAFSGFDSFVTENKDRVGDEKNR